MPENLKSIYQKTRYPGIFERHLKNGDIVFYAFYRRDDRQIKDKIGGRSRGWSAKSASEERALRIAGKSEPTVERKKRLKTEQEADANRMTFKRLLEEYLACKPHLRSAKALRYNFGKHSAHLIGDKLPEELTHWDIEPIRHSLVKAKARPKTIFNTLEYIKRLVTFGFKRGLCANLSFHIELPTVHNKTTEFLNPDEFRRLVAALEQEPEPICNFFTFILFTGMRRGELQTLKWSDIDLHRKLLIIRPENAKSGREESIPLSAGALDVLRRQGAIKDQRQPHVATPDLVFFTIAGNVWGRSQSAVTKIYKRLHENADLPESFRMAHGLRHQFGGMHANAGTPPILIQKMMQHKELRTTQRYIEITEPTLRSGAELTDQLVGEYLNDNPKDLETTSHRKSA